MANNRQPTDIKELAERWAKGKQSFQQTAHNQIHDIQPGGNKAILTLSSGKQIVLTGAKNGVLANQGNAAITKTADGKIVYKAGSSSNETNTIIAFNMITTPRGGQFQVVLPDGSQVWLNAASSIKYPTVFAGKERKIDLTGEAYFEVIHNNKKPFRVVTGNQIVEDIGTHFDINAYNDEPNIKTTLLEGSINLLIGTTNKILKPGQEPQVRFPEITIIIHAGTEEAVAWQTIGQSLTVKLYPEFSKAGQLASYRINKKQDEQGRRHIF